MLASRAYVEMQHPVPAPRLALSLALAALACGLGVPAPAGAASKIKIAAIGDAAPGGGQFAGPALTGSPSAAGTGWVAFRTRVTGGATAEQIVGTNLDPAAAERFVVASLGGSAGKVGGKELGTFKQFLGRPTVNAQGDVAFVASLTNSDAIPGGVEHIGEAQPAGVFLHRRSAPPGQQLRVIALARDVVADLGALDLLTPLDPLAALSSIDIPERTPGLNDQGDVAFAAATFDDETLRAGGAIFVGRAGADPSAVVRLGDTFGAGTLQVLGAPALNAGGTLAFRGSVDDVDGVFKLVGGAITRLAADGDTLTPREDPLNEQVFAGFGDLVALNEAGDVAFTAGGMLDLSTFSSTDFESGVVVARGSDLRLVTFPGREVSGFGRVRGGSLGPDGGGEVAPPSLEPDGSVHVFGELTGGNGQAFFHSHPPDYDLGVPLVIFGGADPDPSPLGGFFFAAVSGPTADAAGNLSFFTRLASAQTSEALIFLPESGAGNSIAIGDATPTKGSFAGPPFSSPVIGDDDQVLFKSFVAAGPSALGLFRWRKSDAEKSRLAALVRTGDAAPLDGAPLILDLPGEPSLNASGEVALAAVVAGRGRGVFVLRADGLHAVALPNDFVPVAPEDAQFEGVAANPLMLADGSVVFRASFSYQDPIDFFSLVREEGIFRVDAAGTMSLLARTTQASPTGERFFRLRDPGTAGGTMIAFRAPLGDTNTVTDPTLLQTGLFLIDPQAAISTVVLQNQDLGGGLTLSGLTGRPTVDLAGNVVFLGTVAGAEEAALLRRTSDGSLAILAAVGRSGPAGGTYRSIGRPAMSPAGHVAYRGSFVKFAGGTSGFFRVSDGAAQPFVEIGEADNDGEGGRFTSLSPTAALNTADHLAFIASVSAGKSRNGLFLASPTTTVAQTLQVRLREKLIDGVPFPKGVVRGRVTLRFADLGAPFRPQAQTVSILCNDAQGPLFSATIAKGGLVKRGGAWVPSRRVTGLRHFQLRTMGKKGVRVAFASAPWDVVRDGTPVPPLSVRIDAGSHSGTTIVQCTRTPEGGVNCAAS